MTSDNITITAMSDFNAHPLFTQLIGIVTKYQLDKLVLPFARHLFEPGVVTVLSNGMVVRGYLGLLALRHGADGEVACEPHTGEWNDPLVLREVITYCKTLTAIGPEELAAVGSDLESLAVDVCFDTSYMDAIKRLEDARCKIDNILSNLHQVHASVRASWEEMVASHAISTPTAAQPG